MVAYDTIASMCSPPIHAILPPCEDRFWGKENGMRTYLTLDRAEGEADRGILTLTSSDSGSLPPHVAMRREGDYLAMSFSLGPAELALRLKTAEVTRAL